MTETKRPVGRPRSDGGQQLTRDKLLKATAKLIAANGYTGTSFRKIAAALDVTTASIFHLYPSKEALLNALIAYAAAPSLHFYDELKALKLPAPNVLYKSIFEEAIAVSSVDHDYVSIFYLPELRRPEFAEAQAVRAEMVTHYRKLVEQGQKQKAFVVSNAFWTAEQIFQLTETSILADDQSMKLSIVERARETARLCLRALLINPEQLNSIEASAKEISLNIDV